MARIPLDPPRTRLYRLAEWYARRTYGQMPDPLAAMGHNLRVLATDALPAELPAASACKDRASGLLASSISKLHAGYLMWFRPEVFQTVRWGGDPTKPVLPAGDGQRLHPRKSFEIWKEAVSDRSLGFLRDPVLFAVGQIPPPIFDPLVNSRLIFFKACRF